jgi:hypothetical protein
MVDLVGVRTIKKGCDLELIAAHNKRPPKGSAMAHQGSTAGHPLD